MNEMAVGVSFPFARKVEAVARLANNDVEFRVSFDALKRHRHSGAACSARNSL